MKTRLTFLLGISVVLFISAAPVMAQNDGFQPSEERSDFNDRRKSLLDANTLRATYHNFGWHGRTNEDNRDELYFEYPKNTNRRYIYFLAVFMGAEVFDQRQENLPADERERFPVVSVAGDRVNPQTGDTWALNPVTGYFNEDSDELARSDRGPGSQAGNSWPSVWPDKLDDPSDPGWPGQWNGFFGKDIFNADQEFFYRSGDDLYTRFSQDGRWRPDDSDPERGGLGLIIDSRVLAWTQNLISDVHFNIFEVRNDASYDYDKVSFTLWTADWVGTPQNDRPFFDQQRATAFYTDTSPRVSPQEYDGTAIGVAGIRFLETPGNAVDGIDNDGDSDFYNPQSSLGLFDSRNRDVYTPLTTAGGGFISSPGVLQNELLPLFTVQDFTERQLFPGDPIVIINDDDSRTLLRYPPDEAFGPDPSDTEMTIISQGRELVLLRGGMTVREDTLLVRNLNLLDDDLDGLIDENQPNHLTLSRFIRGNLITRPVRYINYRWIGYFDGHNGYPGIGGWTQSSNGDWTYESLTVQRGLVVPDEWIEQRMQSDAPFADRINSYQEMLRENYSRRPSTPIFPESHFDKYYQNELTSAPMIDESRDDFFDNNLDWAQRDDVGIDGVEGTGSRGESDGFPTSGAFTAFPGEPNLDKTDVRETDAIGISSASFRTAGGLGGGRNFRADRDVWDLNMVPGRFELAPDVTQDTDQFITSSFFPLRRGQIERFAVAVTVAASNTNPLPSNDVELATSRLDQAFNAYDANYQFAIAPPPPNLTAVPGDGRITLYWDDESEQVFDRYLERLGVNPRNFEGYRIYRSTDAALVDIRKVSDGRGNLQFLQPIAQFDKKNGITGNHPIDINGVEFFLGNDTGLQRHYVDTDVINGREYYYIVTAYNSGAALAGIAPSESPISLSINPDGSLTSGVNVMRVKPGKTSAGYRFPAELQVSHTGPATGQVFADILDPRALKADNQYRISFTSEVVPGDNGSQVEQTTGFTLTNVTTGEVLIDNSPFINGEDNKVTEGFRITLINDSGEEDVQSLSIAGWRSERPDGRQATLNISRQEGTAGDYIIVFDDARVSESAAILIDRGSFSRELASLPANFRIVDAGDGADVPFAWYANPLVKRPAGSLSSLYSSENRKTDSDIIYLLNEKGTIAWQIGFEPYIPNEPWIPQKGEMIHLTQSTQFTSRDEYTFTVVSGVNTAVEDTELASANMDNIRVVPNPYRVTHLAEPRPTAARPQQLRQLHFTNLPARCTIRVFTVSGRLVQTLNVNNSIDNGTYVWDMLTKDNLELSYGVYIYYVDAPGVGSTTGKFAVMK
jgi:hypothetical protein